MIELLDSIYQPKRMDKFTPATKANVNEMKAISDMKIAELLIHVNDIARATNVTLKQGEELDGLVVEFTNAIRGNEQYEREALIYDKREFQYQDGSIIEKTKRLFGSPNIHPSMKHTQKPGYESNVASENNMAEMIQIFKQSQQDNKEQSLKMMEMFNSIINSGVAPIPEKKATTSNETVAEQEGLPAQS